MPHDALEDACVSAIASLRSGIDSPWHRVAGPTAAVVTTACRIGWSFVPARLIRDDIGRTRDMLRHSPAALTAAVATAVRRWRFARIVKQFPAAVPLEPDSGMPARAGDGTHAATIILDAGLHLGSLLGARSAKVESAPAWDSGCRAWLISAVPGGQCTQARRAAVPVWEADPRGWLCFAEVGQRRAWQ